MIDALYLEIGLSIGTLHVMRDALEQHLLKFDGRAVSLLSETRIACSSLPGYLDDLAALCFDPRKYVSDGATWIIKAELDDGVKLPPDATECIVASLGRIQSWQAALHLCQSVEKLSLSPAQAKRFVDWAKTYANHSRPFVRAWSLHARVVLRHKVPEFGQEVRRDLQAAEVDKAASVRARVRQLRKTFGLGET